MPVHLAARVHAFVHGLFRDTDKEEAQALHEHVSYKLDDWNLLEAEGRDEYLYFLAEAVAKELEIDNQSAQYTHILQLTANLLDYEQLYVLPDIDWGEPRSVSKWWELREYLNWQKSLVDSLEQNTELLARCLAELCRPIVPYTAQRESDRYALRVQTRLVSCIGGIGLVYDEVISIVFVEELVEQQLLNRLRSQLERNLIQASGGNPADPRAFTKQPVLPSKSAIKDPATLTDTYLGATPLANYLDQTIEFVIPTESRFEHTHILAGSGHGKTQTLQYLIAEDLAAVAAGKRSILVIDSQGDLIKNIAQLAEFAPGGQLHDKIVLIDPTDVEYPVSLNLFDVGIERLEQYDLLERERLTNSILELYDFVLGSLLSAEMTQKQSVIFRYVTRLMLHIPDATIHTLRELMEPDSHLKFADNIEQLSGTARQFFEAEFKDREFTQTKKQVLRRLWGILENQTFERMFSHPRSKLDLFSEMNAGKVILVNTAKDLLKEQGSEIFGRFFIALVAQAAQERATLPVHHRMPTFVYIDEAADYFDRNINLILAQARKYKVGMVLAHQYLGQLEPKLQEAFAANTSIKLAGGISTKDARTLAPTLHSDPEFIERQPKGSFASYVRGHTVAALPLSFPLGYLESKPRMSDDDWLTLKDQMREQYAVHYSSLQEDSATEDAEDGADADVEDVNVEKKQKPVSPDVIDTEAGAKW